MVDTKEINHLKGEWLLVEVVRLAKGDTEPDVPEGHGFLPRHNPIEWCPTRVQAAPRDAHPIKGASVECVEAVAPIHQHLDEVHGAHDRADHERVAP